MDNFLPWRGRLAVIFLLTSTALNCLHFIVFQDKDYIFKFILAQLGFLPVSAYLVTVIINQLLRRREKQIILKKLNMVIGSFFSQLGSRLLFFIAAVANERGSLDKDLLINGRWQSRDYQRARSKLVDYNFNFDKKTIDWPSLRTLLVKEKRFLVALLGNQNLLEHERFTELLWAVFHLAEELENRPNLSRLNDADCQHLKGDFQRVNTALLGQWLEYMEHLQTNYPFLFSLAVRTNPFDPQACVEIREKN